MPLQPNPPPPPPRAGRRGALGLGDEHGPPRLDGRGQEIGEEVGGGGRTRGRAPALHAGGDVPGEKNLAWSFLEGTKERRHPSGGVCTICEVQVPVYVSA